MVSAGGDTKPGPQNETGVTHLGSISGSAVSWLCDHGAHMSIELACPQSPLWSWSGTGFGKWWPTSQIWPTTMFLCGSIAKNSSYTFKWLGGGNQKNTLCHMKFKFPCPYVKFYWNTSIPDHLYTACGGFHTKRAELSSYDRPCGRQS